MANRTMFDLLPYFDGWSVIGAFDHDGLLELRLASGVVDGPKWVNSHGLLFVNGTAAGSGLSIGAKVSASERDVALGSWQVDSSTLLAAQMLESAIVVVDDLKPDPVANPQECASEIIESGRLIWPATSEVPDELRRVSVLEGITKVALVSPSLVCSVLVESDESVIWDTFLTPFGALELERAPERMRPVAVSYLPVSDLPSRLRHRTGLSRLMGPWQPVWCDRKVSVRTTFMDDSGLVAGALEWEESSTGEISTEAGALPPMGLLSELLRMLPGGDVNIETASKKPVGGQ